jgi:hypothetical protein
VAPDTRVHPLHDEKVEPGSDAAVSVTVVAGDVLGTEAVHPSVEPVVQEMLPPVTVPRPVPDVFAVRSQASGWNVAVTVFAAVMVTVHVVPLADVQPDQLFSKEPVAGVAVSVTVLPLPTVVVQPAGSAQSSPAPAIAPVPPA